MDPLSIIGTSLTIAGGVRVAIAKAQELRHGRDQIHALANEISDLTIMLLELEKCLRRPSMEKSGQNPQFLQGIVSIRNRLTDIGDKLTAWVHHVSASKASREGAHMKWLRAGAKAKSFQAELVSIRSHLNTVLSMVSTSTTSKVEVDLHEIYLLSSKSAAEQRQLRVETVAANETQLMRIEEISDKLDRHFDRSEPETLGEGQRGSTNTVVSHTSKGKNALYTANEAVRAFHHNGSILFASEKMSASSAVGIRTAHFSRSACKPWCACRCHRETKWCSPSILQSIIGSLFVGYSGMPRQRLSCDETSCQLQSQPVVYVTYFFPSWFLARAISVMVATTPLAGPVVSLKVQRTVPGDADIFTYARLGNVDKIKTLFEQGLASPHDVSFQSGITPMHIAINYQQINVCRFLLKANADPFLEDKSRWAAVDSAWTKILSGAFGKDSEGQLREMFADTDCIERRELTMLHRIILGFVSINLKTELDASTKEINAVDFSGRTALSMAAGRSDLAAVTHLLDYSANPNISSPSQGSPLHFAAIAKEPDCLSKLISYNAHVDGVTNWDQTPLHHVAAYKNDARHALLLIKAGANVNARDRDGITPLQWTVVSNNEKVARALLSHGAHVNNIDNYGSSALLQAIKTNRHTILPLLVAKTTTVGGLGNDGTILHRIAHFADLETMSILSSLDFSRIALDARDSRGLVALDLLQLRNEHDISTAFSCLLQPPSSVEQASSDAAETSLLSLEEAELNPADVVLDSFDARRRTQTRVHPEIQYFSTKCPELESDHPLHKVVFETLHQYFWIFQEKLNKRSCLIKVVILVFFVAAIRVASGGSWFV